MMSPRVLPFLSFHMSKPLAERPSTNLAAVDGAEKRISSVVFPEAILLAFSSSSRFLSNEGGNDFLGTINLLPVCKTKPYERSRYVMSVAPKELLDVNTRIALFQNSLDLSCSSILPRSPLPFSRSPA